MKEVSAGDAKTIKDLAKAYNKIANTSSSFDGKKGAVLDLLLGAIKHLIPKEDG